MRSFTDLIAFYANAKAWVISSTPYGDELYWQRSLSFTKMTEHDFLREYAWVVLNCGFRESVVRKKFDYISLCFCDFESAEEIVRNADVCVGAAQAIFNNEGKLRAILSVAQMINQTSFRWLLIELARTDLAFLRTLPFIGNTTCNHLAKNLGFDVAKNDRHLARLANEYGYADAKEMCRQISLQAGDSIADIDLILWRYKASNLNRANSFW